MTQPIPEDLAERMLDAQLHLLDRQVIDAQGIPITTVDDVELADVPYQQDIPPGTPAPEICALLSGPVLGTRIFGGRPPASRLQRIEWSDISRVGVTITLTVGRETLDLTWTESWVRDRIIGRIPGGRHDPD
jgi:hypothetical protein